MGRNNKAAFYDKNFIEFLCNKGYNNYVISQILGVKIGNIARYIVANKIARRYNISKTLTPNQVDIAIREYSEGKTQFEIAKGFSTSVDNIWYLFKKINIETREPNDKIYKHSNFNNNAFYDMTDEFPCYYYGLLLADGCLTKNKSGKYNSVSIYLKSQDRYMIENLHNYLGMDTKIHDRKHYDKRTSKIYESSGFSFNDTNITNRLVSYGFAPRKSLAEVPPPCNISNNRNFWRGVIDGDGCVRVSDRNYLSINLVGSYDIVKAFYNFIEMNITIKTHRKIKEINKLHSVTFTGEDARNIARLLYQNSNIHLHRKFNVVSPYLGEYA